MTIRPDPWNYAIGLVPPIRTPRAHPEEDLQRAIIQHWRLRGNPKALLIHVPNGEVRSKRTGAKLKAMGTVAGTPDLLALMPDGRCGWIELKASGNYQSPAQKAFQAHCEAIGVPYEVCYTLDKAIAILTAWGVLK